MKNKKYKVVIWIVLTLYLVVLLKLIVLKHLTTQMLLDHISTDKLAGDYYWNNVNLVPFETITRYIINSEHFNNRIIFDNIVGNILAFVPLGVMLEMLASKRFRMFRVVFYSLMFSLFFETCQYFMRIGSFDVDDLILNTFGGYLGYLCCRLGVVIFKKIKKPL